MSRKAKIYIRTTISFTIIFAIIATAFLGILWANKFFAGELYDFDDDSMQKSYVNVLLCGVDKDGYRTDVLILAQLNLITNTVNMLQFSRDTYVSINKVDKKINSAYGYNKETQLFKEVEHILPGVKVDKFMLVNINGFHEIINALGGVEFDVPMDMDYDDPYQDLHIHLSKGVQTLDGDKAEQLVRFRKDNDGNDIESLLGRSRIDIQRDFIYAAIKQVFSIKNVTKIPKLISIATDNVKTNLTYEDFEKYAPLVLDLGADSINVMALPGEDNIINGGWYYIHDPAATAQVIAEYFTPSQEEISTQELAIRNQLIGGDSETFTIPQGLVLTEEFKNRFLSVDIVDGSNGTVDIDEIVRKIEEYGFNVKDISEASTVDYPKTIVIAKKDNDDGAKIAKAIGVESFMINPDKRNGTSVTVIVGDDLK